jgi:hypothetical protein
MFHIITFSSRDTAYPPPPAKHYVLPNATVVVVVTTTATAAAAATTFTPTTASTAHHNYNYHYHYKANTSKQASMLEGTPCCIILQSTD